LTTAISTNPLPAILHVLSHSHYPHTQAITLSQKTA
jgi:hypothetical protein